ncbi:NAD-dependent succinate-semialdehyde dehydrogenase [Leucobacter alluvii]|uniref:NAD-dependent succinate-semialdehyde dehydrogenase n=1 Tax=Leucobacter alluvii TaxID=340321 RepID=A0ABN3B958_9MICO
MNAVDASVEHVLGAAHAAFADWHRQSVAARAQVLARAATLYEERADALAEQMALDMGKPIAQGLAEVRSCIAILSYYADNAADLLAPDLIAHEDGNQAEVRLQAIGVVLGVMPWNYPHYQLIRCIAPNLLLGNAVAFKHASICGGSAALVEALFIDAGAPRGLVRDTGFTHAEVFAAIAHPLVSGVSFTGGERAGAAIAEAAGAALTKVVLELGGSDPFIVFDASRARELARLAATMRLSNAGQTCVSPKRIIVRRDLLDQFVDDFTAEFFSALPGDPLDGETRLGPLSNETAADELRGAVRAAQQQGAEVRGSFERDDEDPRRFAPVVLLEPLRELPVWHEELFGPVAMIVGADTIDEAIELANDSPYGLGATVFADTSEAAERCATEIVAGMVSINRLKGGSPALPFGGVKRSGFGRELGAQGLREFSNQKVVVIDRG